MNKFLSDSNKIKLPDKLELLHINECVSTQDEIKKRDIPDKKYLCIISDIQTAARGRFGRVWQSPLGGLWFSIGYNPVKKIDTEVFSINIAQTIISVLKDIIDTVRIELKEPNDIYIEDKKVCGILIETESRGSSRIGKVIIGVGLNYYNDKKYNDFDYTNLSKYTDKRMKEVFYLIISKIIKEL